MIARIPLHQRRHMAKLYLTATAGGFAVGFVLGCVSGLVSGYALWGQ